MNFNIRENKNGITLIALIITIIVLLILAGVSITTLTGENGILNRATNAREVNDKASAKEEIQLGVMASYGVDGNVDNDLIKENLSKINGITGIPDTITDESYPLTVTVDGKTFEIGKSGTVAYKTTTETQTGDVVVQDPVVQDPPTDNYADASTVFDSNGKKETDTGYDENKLHIGDFVNYNAGTWTAEEISAIKTGTKGSEVTANGTTSLPDQAYQFGGFTAGSSRDGNATPYNLKYYYAKDENNKPITGWRVFDVDTENNKVILISAGCPEDYYHRYADNSAYISEYILTGSTTGSITTGDYTKRDWSIYKNNNAKATDAKVLTKSALEAWYNKYMGQTNANVHTSSTFQTIQGTKYESMVDNYSYYWLCAPYGASYMCSVSPNARIVGINYDRAFGVRLLVSLSDVQLEKTTETKKVVYRDATTEYSVWNYK